MNIILESQEFLVIFILLIVVFFTTNIVLLLKFNNLNKKYKKFIVKFESSKTIEEDLENYMYRVQRVEGQNAKISGDIDEIRNILKTCIKRVSVVRYNAFEDVGSNLSFVIALLDDNKNGILLNGIYSRESSNIFAKTVKNGKSLYATSKEEDKALKEVLDTCNDKKK